MKSLLFFFRNRIKNPFRKIVDQYIRYKSRQLRRNGIHSYTYQDSDFVIHYHMGGKGPVLLFIHGFAMDALMNWADQLCLFSGHFTVIAPDLQWFGKSHSTREPVLATQREAIERLLHELKIDRLHVVGQSYGGFVAMELALKNPGLVDKLCIANCPGSTFDDATLEPLISKNGVQHVGELFITHTPLDIRRLLYVSSFKKPYFPVFVLKQLHHLFFDKYHTQWRNMLYTLSGEKDRIESLEPLKQCHAMVLWGEEDALFLKSEGEKFAKTIDCPFVTIPKTGHATQLDDAKAFNRELKRFFLSSM
ncbi:MAG: alpha/beta fold hydrolase [Bacteroidota bacterium]